MILSYFIYFEKFVKKKFILKKNIMILYQKKMLFILNNFKIYIFKIKLNFISANMLNYF